ncbi:protein of unknown function [Mesotoga infera]|uniref:Uncharacterized protein n=1 Tax=Mesotoga infera TaxID=1236046 RepID=A0A7Z7PNC8_9BACT|nr:protein of unknown function [Mesotoga infera]
MTQNLLFILRRGSRVGARDDSHFRHAGPDPASPFLLVSEANSQCSLALTKN